MAIAANTATYSVAESVLLRPLPYPKADRLVRVTALTLPGIISFGSLDFSDRGYWHFVENNRVFEQFGGYSTTVSEVALTGEGPPLQIDLRALTASAFEPPSRRTGTA